MPALSPQKLCLLLLLYMHAGLMFGQIQLKGVIIADSTQEVIPYAHVYIKNHPDKTFIGTVSDLDGRFALTLPEKSTHDTLTISYVGYQSSFIPIHDLSDKSEIPVRLKEAMSLLPTIVYRDLTASELLSTCIGRISQNYLDVSFKNNCSYWQAVKEDGVYTGIKQSNLWVVENNAKHSMNRTIEKDSLLHMKSNSVFYLHFLDSIKNILYFDFVRSGSAMINPKNFKEWRYEYDTKAVLPENYVIVHARRLDKLGELKILINDHDYSFEKIEFNYQWNKTIRHNLNDSMDYNMDNLKGVVLYQKNQQKYNMKYMFVDVTYKVYDHGDDGFTRNLKHELSYFPQ